MITTYIKIAWRNLLKNKAYSFINILGLGLGVAASILISLYVHHETSYDNEVREKEHVYRMYATYALDGNLLKGVAFSANTASTLKENFAEIDEVARLMPNPLFPKAGQNQISIEDDPNQFYESGFTYADPSLLDIMDIEMLHGNRSNALSDPLSIVISESKADKYFKGQNPVGRLIYLNGNKSEPTRIGGVMKDFASNSHLDYDFILTMEGVEFGEGEQTRWLQNNYATYLKFKEGTDIQSIEKKISDNLILDYVVPALRSENATDADKMANDLKVKIQPLTDIHLKSAGIQEWQARGDIKFIWLFRIIASFILLIASINYINLSTARSANRAKEVGLRKVVGSSRKGLVTQFLAESVLTVMLSFVIGIIIASLALPFFNSIADLSLYMPWQSPAFVLSLASASILIGILAGLYPAFYLSSFKPNDVLKGKIRQGAKSAGIRSSLVVFQFSIAIILIAATIVVNKQLNFILNSNLGFEKDQVVQLYGSNMLGDKSETFRNELENIPGVSSASISDYLPLTETKRNGNSFFNEGQESLEAAVFGQAWIVDQNYFKTLGLNLLEGRNFDPDSFEEERSVIINQRMADNLNLENPIGKKISRGGGAFEIIGLMEDFNFSNLKQKVDPLALFYGISNSIISIKIDSDKTSEVLASIDEKWAEFLPYQEIRKSFMDDSFALMYENVSRMRSLFSWFTGLTILIACLGLFTLSAFVAEQRKKEMSIRKVLGASFQQIFTLLTKQFLNLILISLLIAIPTTVYFLNKWLEDYEYKIEITWEVFAFAGLLAVLIALFSVGYHAIRTALINPTVNLKNE